jgi:hypothetical protein
MFNVINTVVAGDSIAFQGQRADAQLASRTAKHGATRIRPSPARKNRS